MGAIAAMGRIAATGRSYPNDLRSLPFPIL